MEYKECHLYNKDEKYTEEAEEYSKKIMDVLGPIIDEMSDKGIPSYEISYFVSRNIEYRLLFKKLVEIRESLKGEE